MATKRTLKSLGSALDALDVDQPAGQPVEAKPTPRAILNDRNRSERALSKGRRRTAAQYRIEPEKCRMWSRHNRLYELLSPQRCAELIDDIRAKGQQTPAIARPLRNDPDGFEYEIIAGARRHFAVSHLRKEEGRKDLLYLVEVRDIDDEEAFLAADAENRGREDISDFEKAKDYERALSDFYGGNVKAMSERIGLARTTLRHYLNLAGLPDVVIEAFPEPTDIALRNATRLQPLIAKEETRERVLEEATEIARLQAGSEKLGSATSIASKAVMTRLLEAAQGPAQRKAPAKLRRVEDETGLVCEIERGRKFLTVRIPIGRADATSSISKEIKKALSG